MTIYQDVKDETGVPHRVAISHEQFEHEAAAIVREQQYAADIKAQGKLLKIVEKTFRKEGFSKIIDGWGDKLDYMKNFK